ncbi:tRNA (5-methylaminomethyl-2-thiouridine)(34)-methyltransferase MnmD [uncultured Maritalea sp.]|jgi:tRNA U34 5-methylaminomethyl-2-thiouridine-forming methyltransferase MnmC|uniref:tRNA (5-methylaminomethyl-2-thiouridine)(34)-methyltransferase MnmD n=1 Tax=uncultured Maritalea sp. TaxID=757249 RepID=UPI002608EBE4|nr:tRNA (5-methylaminomethyl-2-thiouridine)(34)-methyltransferase MnmD [uncultured Maritalea sp.]
MGKDNNVEWHENDMPFSREFGDHFYSRNDGRLECDHVFLRGNSVQDRWANAEHFSIGELGFGTGLNLLETWRQWIELRQPHQQLTFTSFELYPMGSAEILRAITPWPMLTKLCEKLVANWSEISRGKTVEIDTQTTFQLMIGDVRQTLPSWENKADAWFLDGFAPAKNPQMWEAELMQSLATKTQTKGTFATYTVAGWVRRNLQAAGFEVEKCPGHAGKRQMMRGVLQSGD